VFIAISAVVGALLGTSLFLKESRDEDTAPEAESMPAENALA
jgi:hypothetical protein